MKFKPTVIAALLLALLFSGATLAQDKAPVAGALKVDHNHSTIAFDVPIMGGLSRVTGKFTDFDITILYSEADITKSSVTATIRVASISTGIEDRDKDLRSDGFFDAEKYPTITFVSHSIEKSGGHLLARGAFTMKGVTKEIELPFSIAGEFTLPKSARKLIGFHADTKLNRRDYGITWEHQALANFVGDEVGIVLDILA